jgi:hypothetical protein
MEYLPPTHGCLVNDEFVEGASVMGVIELKGVEPGVDAIKQDVDKVGSCHMRVTGFLEGGI